MDTLEGPSTQLVAVRDAPSLDLVTAAWLDAKSKRTGSAKTARAYRDTLGDFRAALHARGVDLDADSRAVALCAQAWAGRARSDGRPVSANTYNQRLAIVSSFYVYGLKRGLLTCGNPLATLDRRPVEAYATARALSFEEVGARLAAIDRTTPIGLRDYALLAVALQTGRRLFELAGLRWQHLHLGSGRAPIVTITWPRAKGDKHLVDTLAPATSRVLLTWLFTAYGDDIAAAAGALAPDTPLWPVLAAHGCGQPMSIQAIADVCEKRMGTSKVHTLRHTFAHGMEEVGAKVSDIQARLGHSSLQTTGRYLQALRSAENAHADDLMGLFGLQPTPPKKRPPNKRTHRL